MELLLLPALRLHMGSGSGTTERWPGGKQLSCFPSVLCPSSSGQGKKLFILYVLVLVWGL